MAVVIEADAPVAVRTIHARVETLLGVSVSRSSVKNAVARLATTLDPAIKRIDHGVYEATQRSRLPTRHNHTDDHLRL